MLPIGEIRVCEIGAWAGADQHGIARQCVVDLDGAARLVDYEGQARAH